MSVNLYDESLCNKINGWLNSPNLKVLGPNETSELFGIQADIREDKPLTLPLITLSRDSDVELHFPHKKPSSFDGIMFDAIGEIDDELKNKILENPDRYPDWQIKKGKVKDSYSLQLNAVPMELRYQLDIYTRYAEQGSEFMRAFIFNFINEPMGKIELPYQGTHWEHTYTVYVDSTVSDNSDIPQKQFKDQFTRWTIGLSIPHAYLFNVHKYDLLKADIIVEADD